ncbi:hypothetical protein PFISCL1PPCAC_18831 [Pristionchus fissidentatus]|uniref:Uncharacterized protein n=1 Tax=Pristionchus fissidentatus TaxID=1538716 RepID=A0AAV5WCI3_9BILA|nr:hypothetical protein PFISCL1PPCAC_18831 [Pristionchus fissidentatus]
MIFSRLFSIAILLACATSDKRTVDVKGSLRCVDATNQTNYVTKGIVELMEHGFPDPNDILDFKAVDTNGRFQVSGTEDEVLETEFFLQFTVPCPPLPYCADPVYKYKCKQGGTSTKFTFRFEKNPGEGWFGSTELRKTYDISCRIGLHYIDDRTPSVHVVAKHGMWCYGGISVFRTWDQYPLSPEEVYKFIEKRLK